MQKPEITETRPEESILRSLADIRSADGKGMKERCNRSDRCRPDDSGILTPGRRTREREKGQKWIKLASYEKGSDYPHGCHERVDTFIGTKCIGEKQAVKSLALLASEESKTSIRARLELNERKVGGRYI